MMRSLAATELVPQPVKGVLIRRCAWCSRIIGAVMAPGQTGETSGICRKCYHQMLKGIQSATKEKGD